MKRHKFHDFESALAVNPSIENGNLSASAEESLRQGWGIDEGDEECLAFVHDATRHLLITLKQSEDRLGISLCANPPVHIGCQHKNEGTNLMLRFDDWSALHLSTRLLMRLKHKKGGRPPEYDLVKRFLLENL